eukprot:c3873_g1_i1.p1 GENE.c3873_g1_i1~~c3873_g1_i1.p1  ORF type:complete len:230 (+),score=34.55 c3873_g1_i1:232-921(+)
MFHYQCIISWQERSNCCPLCYTPFALDGEEIPVVARLPYQSYPAQPHQVSPEPREQDLFGNLGFLTMAELYQVEIAQERARQNQMPRPRRRRRQPFLFKLKRLFSCCFPARQSQSNRQNRGGTSQQAGNHNNRVANAYLPPSPPVTTIPVNVPIETSPPPAEEASHSSHSSHSSPAEIENQLPDSPEPEQQEDRANDEETTQNEIQLHETDPAATSPSVIADPAAETAL